MLVSLKELMQEANKNGYGVGAFNAVNLESVKAAVMAAEETGHGIVLEYAQVHEPLITMEEIAPLMLWYANRASVPVCVHLDHGSSLEACMKAIRLGFTSVMLDASGEDYEKNVEDTATICRLAHSVGVTVEAELGHILSSDIGVGEVKIETEESFESVEDIYTDPETARDFVTRTGVDVLAIAFGTAHGLYKTKPKLDLDRITKIKECIDIPFVMHGGSGLSKEEYQTAIRNGVRKINYYTYSSLTGGEAVRKALEGKTETDNVFFHDLSIIGMNAVKEDLKRVIRIFNLEV